MSGENTTAETVPESAAEHVQVGQCFVIVAQILYKPNLNN